jgi:thiol-disulfide isomerase/thioredoxin
VVRLSDLRGKVVWVNFWATWCVPCKQELPDIQAVYDEKKAQGLEVLEVNTQESPDLALPYFEERSLTVPLLLDTRGGVYEQYKLTGLPDSFFIDRDGKVAALYFGQLSPQKMRERLATAGLP